MWYFTKPPSDPPPLAPSFGLFLKRQKYPNLFAICTPFSRQKVFAALWLLDLSSRRARNRLGSLAYKYTGFNAFTQKNLRTHRQTGSQRAKNPVSVSALLTGKFLRVRKVFARLQCNGSLKGPHFSAQCKPFPGKMHDFKLFASEQFDYCFDSLDTVWTV